jgi:hypothetical protein
MFYSAGRVPDEGIYSAVSSDEGLTFTLEPGVRLTAAAAGYERIGGIDIIRLPDGRWRLYTSDRASQPVPGQPFPTETIVSATSSDMQTWTMDPGVRIGAGATVTGSSAHPSAIVNDDGTVTLFYHRFSPPVPGLLTATSADGLSFTSETFIRQQAGSETYGDPDVVRLPDGSLRIYYGRGGNEGGEIRSLRRPASAAARLGRINLMAAAARTNDGARIRSLTDDVLDLAPVTIPRNHSLRERLARAEENFRLGSHHALSEATVVEAMNAMAAAAGSPAYTDVQRFRTYRRSLQSLAPNLRATTLRVMGNGTDMSPVEAVALSLALVNSNLESGDPGVTWQAYRLWLERSLADEESQASTTAHDLLSLAGIRR